MQAGGTYARAVLGLQQEDRHLGAGDRVVGAVVAAAAAARDSKGCELFDPRREGIACGDVAEHRAGRRRRYFGRPSLDFIRKTAIWARVTELVGQ